MKEDRRPQEICAIWIYHTNRIISFRKEDGFEPRAFLSPDEQMQYALEKCSNGCRVQCPAVNSACGSMRISAMFCPPFS